MQQGSLLTTRSRTLLAGTALACLLVAEPVLAQSAQTAADAPAQTSVSDSDTGTIIVTARRREERLVDVPIAVTTLSGAQLERTGAIDITEIAQSAPT